jgi:Tfp pilus assembly PilM family ATPase
MSTMLRFLAQKPSLGIEITASAVMLAAVSVRGGGISVEYAKAVDLPSGIVAGSFTSPNICDESVVINVLRECLSCFPRSYQRAGLSLPDQVFRVQTIEFDDLPARKADRDRLIRWRLEKTAAFDLADTVLRYQVMRHEKGFSVLACVAKRAVIEQYESVLRQLGLEPWSVGVSSFHILNFYFPLMSRKSSSFALAHLADDSFTTVVTEAGGTRFYRFKDMKRVSSDEIKGRFVREIEDSLHFYFTHRDRVETSEVRFLYLTGISTLPRDLAEGISIGTPLSIKVLTPDDVLYPKRDGRPALELPPAVTAALGAGSGL